MKKILILDCHPNKDSFCAALAEEYSKGAKEGKFDVKFIKLRDLKFDNILHYSSGTDQKLEPDLVKQQELLTWCNHLVVITPVWWNGVPGLFKGYLDRMILGGFAYKFNPNTGGIEGMLAGRTMRAIYTQGSTIYDSVICRRDCFWMQLKLNFALCGFKPIKRTCFWKVKGDSNAQNREKYLKDVRTMGKLGK
jgi:putative NADPH-quinone reductase